MKQTGTRKLGILPEWRKTAGILLIIVGVTISCGRQPADPTGTWRGRAINNTGEQVAFTLRVERKGDEISGSFVNGEETTTSTAGSFDGRTLKLEFDYYDAEFTATIDGDRLTGTGVRPWKTRIIRREMQATRVTGPDLVENNPEPGPLSGEWALKVGGGSHGGWWRASFQTTGTAARGVLIPVSGDSGRMTGTFENGELTLNRFDGFNSRILKARLKPDGRLEGYIDLGLFEPRTPVVAERLTSGNRGNVSFLPDPENYARMANPAEPLKFSFPDLNGKMISSTDPAFRGKVVLVTITGSWCPNCHDEAPITQQYYERYRDQGLEVVALAFEYTGRVDRDLEQLRIFAKRYGITYPMLLAGSTEEGEIQLKLPQLINFGGYPTTIFIGRNGLVRRIHTGFDGKATGERHTRLLEHYETMIKELLAEPAIGQ